MAKKAIVARGQKRKKLVIKNALKRKRLKRDNNTFELDKLSKNASPVRLRNICWLCHRPRFFISKFALCRQCFKKKADNSEIPGVKKVSW